MASLIDNLKAWFGGGAAPAPKNTTYTLQEVLKGRHIHTPQAMSQSLSLVAIHVMKRFIGIITFFLLMDLDMVEWSMRVE